MKAAPSTPKAIPRAPRAPAASWAATAAIPVNASPFAPTASANATEPDTGSPRADSTTDSSAATATLAVTAVSRPAVSAACRPTTAEPTSSRRPASSSPLVCLITMKTVISAQNRAAQTPIRQAVSAPTEDPFSCPYRNRSAGLPPPLTTSWSRAAAVEYSFLKV